MIEKRSLIQRCTTQLCGILAVLVFVTAGANRTIAQDFNPLDLNLNGFGDVEKEPITISAEYKLNSESAGQLMVTAEMGQHWHVYSVTQAPGGPTKTQIQVQSPDGVKITGPFTPDLAPKKSKSPVYDGLTVEEHVGIVVWTAPIAVPAGFNGDINLVFSGLVCEELNGKCSPVDQTPVAKLIGAPVDSTPAVAAAPGPPAPQDQQAANNTTTKATTFREDNYAVLWSGSHHKTLKPGLRGVLAFTAKPNKNYHVYTASAKDEDSRTNFGITQKGGFLIGAPQTSEKVIEKEILPGMMTRYHKSDVTWYLPFDVPKDAKPGEHKIEGSIAYQACDDKSCLQPKALKFTAIVNVADKASNDMMAMALQKGSRGAAMDAANGEWPDKVKPIQSKEKGKSVVPPVDSKEQMGFPLMLLFAFIGGIILNVMPCVLPVVGIKVMSFVQQAGEDRKRIFALNLVYAAGIFAVFALLAGLAIGLSLSWGEHFQNFWVRYSLTLLLFAMALSYLGVWEIPAPGMSGSQDLQSKEGYTGAFFKGVFATILSTPCSGPLLGGVLGLTIGLQPIQTFTVIMVVGLGMAFPYLIIGARPSLVSWLPKPGDWMVTLKEFLAFLFLGTVAFFFNQFKADYKLLVFVSLIAVWFGCWLFGKGPVFETVKVKAKYWLGGIASAAVIILATFQYLGPAKEIVPFEPYSPVRLAELQKQGKTVLVDFTADWCVNCKVNLKLAINTTSTKEVLDELDAVPMLADWTDKNDLIKSKLTELNSRSIPLLVIYPGSDPDNPIVLRDLVSQGTVLDALKQAGPSVSEAQAAASNTASTPSNVAVMAP